MVQNVRVILSDTSAVVSWDTFLVSASSVYSVHGYLVYYNSTREEQSVTVPNTENSLVIGDLESSGGYQFQVAVIVELNGVLITGVLIPAAAQQVCK